MSSVNRVISSSLASWMRIGVGIVSQVVAVPIFLSYWDLETYGAWLLIQTVISLMTVADVAHQNYLGYEFLKLGRDNRSELATIFCTAIPIAFMVSLVPFFGLSLLVYTGTLNHWTNINPDVFQSFEIALLVMLGTWVITGSVGGIIGRVLYPFNYYPLLAWSGTVFAIISAIIPVLVVSFGGGIVDTAIVFSLTNIAYNIVLMFLLIPAVKRERLFHGHIHLSQGFLRFILSLTLASQNGLEILRQQGSRVILMLVTDMAQMTAFSTIRTGANFALQGLNTITGPIMPELMRFLVARDQKKTESTFAVVWLVLCAALSPAVIVVQYVAPELFPLWSKGKFIFDPILFSMLSLSVLVYGLAQPAIAIIQGNNILRPQLLISLITASIAVGTMYVLVPLIGIRGAAVALLLAEFISLLSYLLIATRWLQKAGMHWPWRAFLTAFSSVIIAGAGMIVLAKFPETNVEYFLIALLAETLIAVIYWHTLPQIARQRAGGLARRIMPKSLNVSK